MPKLDLEHALSLHADLMQAVMAHRGGRDDATMSYIATLCASAVDEVRDLDARVTIRSIESLARLLFSGEGHEDIESGALRGTDALRFQIFNALSNLRGRLQVLRALGPSKPEVPALDGKKHLRVLVVEDNRDSAEALQKLLELVGYAVTVAHNSREGLEAAQQVRPDIVLCDIGLPDSDGFALAAALRRNPATARARLIAVTAYGSEEDKKRSREVGFQLHLVKPVEPENLLQQLAQPRPKSAQS